MYKTRSLLNEPMAQMLSDTGGFGTDFLVPGMELEADSFFL